MIDDFWFTDCTCAECDAARRARTVTIGEKKYPVAGDSWEDYRSELMVRHPENEKRIFDFVGMLGLPLAPCHDFPTNALVGFFSIHALKDPGFEAKLSAFIQTGKPVLLTDGLAQRLTNRVPLHAPNVRELPIKGDPKSLLQLSQKEINELRAPVLRPIKTSFTAPNQVALYLFADASWVVENFNDAPVNVVLNGKNLNVPARGWQMEWK